MTDNSAPVEAVADMLAICEAIERGDREASAFTLDHASLPDVMAAADIATDVVLNMDVDGRLHALAKCSTLLGLIHSAGATMADFAPAMRALIYGQDTEDGGPDAA